MSNPYQEPEANYYTVLSSNIRYDRSISGNVKELFYEIISLSREFGYCWATNHYFSKLFGVTTRTIQEWVLRLEENGYVKRELIYNEDGVSAKGRKLYPNYNKRGVKSKTSWGGEENFRKGVKKTSVLDNNNKLYKSNLTKISQIRGCGGRKNVINGYSPSPDLEIKLKEKYKDLDYEFELSNFYEFFFNRQEKKINWDMALQTWFRKSEKYRQDREKRVNKINKGDKLNGNGTRINPSEKIRAAEQRRDKILASQRARNMDG